MAKAPEDQLRPFSLLREDEEGKSKYKTVEAQLIVSEGADSDQLTVYRLRNGSVWLHGRPEDGRGGLRWQLIRLDAEPRFSERRAG